MKKRSVILGLVLASMMLIGCGNNQGVAKEQAPKDEKVEVSEQGPGSPDEVTTGAKEPEAKQLDQEVAWVQDSINEYLAKEVHGYTQVNTIELEDGSTRTEKITATVDNKNGMIQTKNEYAEDAPILEYFQKDKDVFYYFSENFETKEMIRTKSSEEDFNRAIEMSANTINLDNQEVTIVGDSEFAGKKVVDVMVQSDNPDYTTFSSLESAISEEEANANDTYKSMVERSKQERVQYHVYFDKESKELVGMSVDNTVTDYFNFYEIEKIKTSKTEITYQTDKNCEKIELPKEYKDA